MRIAWLLAVVAWTLADAGRVLACGSVNMFYFVEAVSPTDGATDFARDGAVMVTVREVTDDPRGAGSVVVRVATASDDEEVKGQLEQSSSGQFTWHPLQPLAANTSYRLGVGVMSWTSETPEDVAVSTFTTSDALSPELALSGQLSATLRAGSADITQCGKCGNDCKVTGQRAVLYADVQTPTVNGGFDAFGYQAWLSLSDDVPLTFDGPGEGRRDGAGLVKLMEFLSLLAHEDAPSVAIAIPKEDDPYDACFAFNAWDPAGHWHSAEPLCVPAADVEAAFAKLGMADAADTESSASSDGGCAVAAPSGGGWRSLGAVWGLAACLTFARLRRRAYGLRAVAKTK